ncbi:NIPSNAP family protein [Jannaschia sp. Os4]|uniref:NIPSNAP family protein n=1 Tax=Jannaschia sp. Os4 TaxID=2807617 RepID=UPI00193ACFEA|nr:NIPSNAP family protein [Jannaschia sp. Os4]MBM2575725.1 NIPSNAP family protein [Jannaschia sp. Os4]
MITCTVRYEIDPDKLAEFERYARFWLGKVPAMGGTHHGYHLPHEGPNDVAYCHFSFPSLAAYERYREAMRADAECQRAYAFAQRTKCIRRYDRSFTKPVLDGAGADELGL